MKNKKIRIGISVGDLNGIGMEVIIKTFLDNRMLDFCTPIIFGSFKTASYHKKILNIKNFSINTIKSLNDISDKKINLVDSWEDDVKINLGTPSKKIGKYAYLSLKRSIEALKEKKIDGLVTAPINKHSVQENFPEFIGHTELLSNEFSGESTMMMVSESMKIACLTSHIPLSKVPEMITQELIIKKIKNIHSSLIKDFKIIKPKIAVMGLNPHAGENGLMGKEELNVIIPAIKCLKSDYNILCFGPYSADSFFTRKNLVKFDGILSMYHDQGLTPFKTLSFSEGVNYTSGLSVVRTSPAHGTAFDIAGKKIANEQSFRESIYLASKIIQNRRDFEKLKENPLIVKTEEN